MVPTRTRTSEKPTRAARSARPVDRPARGRPFIWREALWGLDWLSLRLSPVYLGVGVPKGDGSPVVLVPGFLSTDTYLAELYFWLKRIGYSPYLSGIGVNADCLRPLADRLTRRVEAAASERGRPVRLIGHSLGGFIGRQVALRRPDLVSQLICMGSPIGSLEAHPVLMAAARVVGWGVRTGLRRTHREAGRCDDQCVCVVNHCVPSPPPTVQRAALYSRHDGLIEWRHCLEPEPELNHEVGGTHIGMAFNPRAYRALATVLATANEADARPQAA